MVCNSTEHGLTEMLNKHVYSSLSRFYLMLAFFKAFSYFSWRRLQCDFPSIAQGRVWLLRLSSCWKDRQMEELMEKGNGIKREVGQLHLNGWMDGWMDTSWAKKTKQNGASATVWQNCSSLKSVGSNTAWPFCTKNVTAQSLDTCSILLAVKF